MDDAFYFAEGDTFIPTQATVGPWDPRLQHGGPVAALLGSRFERQAAPSARISHFALEFLGPVPLAPMEVKTTVARPGKKIALLDATASIAGRAAVRASAWTLATSDGRHVPVRIDEPPPPMPAQAASTYFETVPRFGYGDALEWRFAEGAFDRPGPATVWTRLRAAIVRGEPITPLCRVLAMVDSANGISAELDVSRFLFVPVNLTVSLARHPSGEWVGMSATTSLAGDGAGVTRAHLFDERGMLGEALQTLYVEAR